MPPALCGGAVSAIYQREGVRPLKYGLYYYKNTHNIGDDIWAYAQSLFYPRIDYLIDNTDVYKFKSDNNEDVATIIGAFVEPYNHEYSFMPPANIIPHFIGAYFRSTIWELLSHDSLKTYLKAYEPIGLRSKKHVDLLASLGIKAYYSGCVTLTLPAFEKANGGYICMVDVPDFIVDYVRDKVKNRFEIKVMTHILPKISEAIFLKHRELPIDERFEPVKQILRTYSSAHCVVTSNLHTALPCLTQNTPVLFTYPRDGKGITDMETRISDNLFLLHSNHYEDFLEKKVTYDFINPPPNPTAYLSYRKEVIKSCSEFIENCENGTVINKFPYSEKDRTEYLIDILQEKVRQLKYVVDLKNARIKSLEESNVGE